MVIVLGIWTLVVPYLGIPSDWKSVIVILTGILIAFIGFLLRSEAASRQPHVGERLRNQTFVENTPASTMSQSSQPSHDRKEGISSLN